jgi:hypothetical protein
VDATLSESKIKARIPNLKLSIARYVAPILCVKVGCQFAMIQKVISQVCLRGFIDGG